MCSMTGFSLTGINILGRTFVKGASLVPFPPAIITTEAFNLEFLLCSLLSSTLSQIRISTTLSFTSTTGIMLNLCSKKVDFASFFVNSPSLK